MYVKIIRVTEESFPPIRCQNRTIYFTKLEYLKSASEMSIFFHVPHLPPFLNVELLKITLIDYLRTNCLYGTRGFLQLLLFHKLSEHSYVCELRDVMRIVR